jgi:hypothetical protein
MTPTLQFVAVDKITVTGSESYLSAVLLDRPAVAGTRSVPAILIWRALKNWSSALFANVRLAPDSSAKRMCGEVCKGPEPVRIIGHAIHQ